MNAILSKALVKLLRPLVRILLREGVPYGVLADLLKSLYVDVAMKEFGITGRKPSFSRVSIITGLPRREASRVKRLPETVTNEPVSERYNRAARVIAGWISDRHYSDAKGNPKDLLMTGSGFTFETLVAKYSGDVPVRAIFDELERVGAIKKMKNSSLRLLTRAYLPQTGNDDKIAILGDDVAALIATIHHNLLHSQSTETLLQRKVYYDNVPIEALSVIREKAKEKGQTLLEYFNRWLARYDRDTHPSVKGTGRKKCGIGIYYFEEDGVDQSPDSFGRKGKSS